MSASTPSPEKSAPLIGACGLKCSECSAYIATQANDAAAIAKTIEEWRVQHGGDFKPEDVWCDGCMTAGARKCSHARDGCGVRACAVSRGVANCAVCDDYGCETMTSFVEHVPAMRETLEAIRAGRLA